MMKCITKIISPLMIFILAVKISHGEVIYLRDGQVIKGSIINEDSEAITVKNRFQTRKIYRTHVLRILYGDLDMERVYILLKDGTMMKGFLVDQDAGKIVYRPSRESSEEKSISKDNIRQISGEEITVLNPDINVTMGFFFPFNGGGTRLKYAPIYIAGSGINVVNRKDTRILFEAGYSRSEIRSAAGSYFQFIPLNTSAVYTIIMKNVGIMPKIGFGMAMMRFNNGEGDKYQGISIDFVAGMGLQYGIINQKLHTSLWVENYLLSEGNAYMGNVVIRGGLSYMF